MSAEAPAVDQDPRHQANQALDTLVAKLGPDLSKFETNIASVRAAIRTSNNEANKDLDALVQELGSRNEDLNQLDIDLLRKTIKE